jgi:hypothetical protein
MLVFMSKDICLECGRDKNMVGKAHRCVPIPGWVKPRPSEAGPEIHEPPSDPVRKSKAPPATRKTTSRPISETRGTKRPQSTEVVRAAMDAVIDKHAAGKVKLTVRLDKELMKSIKVAAAETETTIEEWVRRALEMKAQG